MEQLPPDDILESLYKLRSRENEKLKTVLEVYNLEIHQKKAKPDYHRLKTMVERSIEQELRMRNFEVKNRRIEHNGQGDCWQWIGCGYKKPHFLNIWGHFSQEKSFSIKENAKFQQGIYFRNQIVVVFSPLFQRLDV